MSMEVANTTLTPPPTGDTAALSPRSERGRILSPAVDIFRSEDGWLVRADLPGVLSEDLTVDVNEGRLTIDASRNDGGTVAGYHRVLLLPDVADAEQIVARLHDGVLELTIPRDQRTRSRRITVTTG